ncbi:MAG: ABC transporter substrate-binding protein [Acidimicrobiales bacterium]
MSCVRKRARLAAACMTLAALAGACGSDAEDGASAGGAAVGTADAGAGGVGCPDTIVIQADWFPEPEHGASYQLIGPNGERDAKKGWYTGPLAPKYAKAFGDKAPKIQVRSGGPYLGNEIQSSILYKDTAITLAYISNDAAVQFSGRLPSLSVVAPLEKNPQIVMWDRTQYDFKTAADIGRSDAKILVFTDQTAFVKYFVGRGDWRKDQIDPSYKGAPDRFVSERGIVQQGFVTKEVYDYENEIAQWRKPVGYLLLADQGFEIYSQALAIRKDDKAKLDGCMKAFVPAYQQAQVDYIKAPDAVNEMLLSYVSDLKSFWLLSPEGMKASVEKMLSLGLVANGPDRTLGNFDEARVQRVIDSLLPIYRNDRLDTFKADVKVSDIVTNEYIDTSIGL